MSIKIRRKSDGEILEFLAFNYDGQGGCLVHFEGSETIDALSLSESKNILLGEECKENKYDFIK